MEVLQLSWEGQAVPLGQQIHSLLPSPYTHRACSCEQHAGFRQLERPGDGLMCEQESRNSQEHYRRGLVKDRISVLECCGVAPGPARIQGLKINKKHPAFKSCCCEILLPGEGSERGWGCSRGMANTFVFEAVK